MNLLCLVIVMVLAVAVVANQVEEDFDSEKYLAELQGGTEQDLKPQPHESHDQVHDILAKLNSKNKDLESNLESESRKSDARLADIKSRIRDMEDRFKLSQDDRSSVADRVTELRAKSMESTSGIRDRDDSISRQREQNEKHRERMEKSMEEARLAREKIRQQHEQRQATHESWRKSFDETRNTAATSHSFQSVKEKYGLSDSLVEEIGRLVSTRASKDAMTDAVRAEFPDRTTEEINEIVMGTINARRRDPVQAAKDRALEREKLMERLNKDRKAAMEDSRARIPKDHVEAKHAEHKEDL